MRVSLALAALMALLSGACSTSATAPTPTPPAPVPAAPVAAFTIGTGGPEALAVGGFTTLTVDASASTGDGLEFEVDFGDGATATTAVSSHVAAPATRVEGERRTARVTVTDRLGRSHSTTKDYFVVNLGTDLPWFTVPSAHSLKLTLSGQGMTGWHTSPENGFIGDLRRSRRLVGRVTGSHGLDVSTDDGAFSFVGSVVWRTPPSAEAWAGGMYQENVYLRLTVRGGIHDGKTFDFRYSDPY